MGKYSAACVIFCAVISSGFTLDTFDGVLSGEYWVELDPLIATEGGAPSTQEEVGEIALQEAQYVFSGMIYGFSFRYVPLDRARQVDEVFELEPIATIVWGDPSLQVAEITQTGNLYHVLIRYFAKEYQVVRVESWQSNSFPSVKANGSARQLGGREAKLDAIVEAAKEGVRSHFRGETRNKPKEISGELVFTAPPYCYLDKGEYIAALSIKIKLNELVPYRVYLEN